MADYTMDLMDSDYGVLQRTEYGHMFWEGKPQPSRIFRTVLAVSHRGHVIGVFQYVLRGREWAGRSGVKASGTLVCRRWRGKGVGAAMWALMLSVEQPKRVYVDVVSDSGWTLVQSVMKAHPNVRFTVTHDGQRALRTLKGKRRAA